MASTTKMKVLYGTEETPEGSKTFTGMNPESTNEALVNTANKFGSMQSKTIRGVERIDTTTIMG